MAIDRKQLDDLISSLKQQRDELAVQIHLGKAEAKEQWAKVTAQLDELTKDYQPAKEAAEESAEKILAALKLVAGEVQDGFQRVRKSL
jgi:chromosome segregation ATPase